MKIWHGYGTEHSMNLVMIGRFKEAARAAQAKALIDQLTARVAEEVQAGEMTVGDGATARFSDAMRELLYAAKVHSLGPAELEQFAYDMRSDVEGDRVVVRTEEVEVSAFLKIMLDLGARIEVYSAHEYPGTGYGRGA